MLDGNTYPSEKLVHSVFGKINYRGLKHNSLYFGLVLPSGGWQSLITVVDDDSYMAACVNGTEQKIF
jgi:hypothetical protein